MSETRDPVEAEIHAILRDLTEDYRPWVMPLLFAFRGSALAGAKHGVGRESKEALVAAARQRLLDSLRELQANGPPSEPFTF